MNSETIQVDGKKMATQSLPMVIHTLIEEAGPKNWNDDLKKCVAKYGEGHEMVVNTKALFASKRKELVEQIKITVDNAVTDVGLLCGITRNEKFSLALVDGFNNRSMGQWRNERILEILEIAPTTDKNLAEQVYMTKESIKPVLVGLKADGKVTESGGKYMLATEPQVV